MNFSQDLFPLSQLSRISDRPAAFQRSKFAVHEVQARPESPDLSAPVSREAGISKDIQNHGRIDHERPYADNLYPTPIGMPGLGSLSQLLAMRDLEQQVDEQLPSLHLPFQPVPQLFSVNLAAAAAPACVVPIIGPSEPMGRSARESRAYDKCAAYRAMLASPDCMYMANFEDLQCVAQMESAFSSIEYEFDHSVASRFRIDCRSFTAEPKWIDHAFWVARHFFSTERVENPTDRLNLIRSFFIISMRLYLIEGGFSRRLSSTQHFSRSTITTPPRDERGPRPSYEKLGCLPISMPASTRFSLGAETLTWPLGVRVGDLWEHDACALFVLVPELITAVLMKPNQHATAPPFRRLLYSATYWPAVKIGDQLVVLVDECVRKICALQVLYFDEASYSVKSFATPYWPVIVPPDEHKKQLARIRKLRETSLKRQRHGDDVDEEKSADARPVAQQYAFNRCRRTDGAAFWLTPYVRWNDTPSKVAVPKVLAKEIEKQSDTQRDAIHNWSNPQDAAKMYPSLYAEPAQRARALARYSNTIQVDAMGEYMRYKSSILKEHMRNIASV